ncbi:diaminobutyrate acetyltransferase [Paracoccus aestuariivivens]|uniref:L-2,4-diaminobutyric acid acetyltransferase n=1 Tax=Paracoccus aestuariivivens TaxID=1820333 RepID=A0A6L6JD79_9RHOB|nr:diaminobutyrate acetyltransferase [Paracoccus aestuariivivens]
MDAIKFRAPEKSDGAAVWELIAHSGSLDQNSLYCNLLQCSHFAPTCVLAERNDNVVGWLSGYVPPQQPDTYFVWQICVDAETRGQGLAQRLLRQALARDACQGVRRVECTITRDNTASWALFVGLARDLGAVIQSELHFDRQKDFRDRHASEHLVSIGPFCPDRVDRLHAA